MRLGNKEKRKIEAIEKQRAQRAKEIKKDADELNLKIKEKQRRKRAAERELVQNSLKNFRETVEKEKEQGAIAMRSGSQSAERKLHNYVTTEQMFDDLLEHVNTYYENYEKQTKQVQMRIQRKLEEKLQSLETQCLRPHSEPKADRSDELANAYIHKLQRYDTNKALRMKSHAKEVLKREKEFKESIKAKRQLMTDNMKTRHRERKEAFLENENHAEQVLKNKAENLAKITSRKVRTEDTLVHKQDRVYEIHEGQVCS